LSPEDGDEVGLSCLFCFAFLCAAAIVAKVACRERLLSEASEMDMGLSVRTEI
jgi:hypothetical protein